MAIGIGISSSSFDEPCTKRHYDPNPELPKPGDYTIIRAAHIYSHLILEIKYNGCTNYEGKKLLVFLDTTLENLKEKNNHKIDPHFSNNKNFISPFARFEPTREGWEAATFLLSRLGYNGVFE